MSMTIANTAAPMPMSAGAGVLDSSIQGAQVAQLQDALAGLQQALDGLAQVVQQLQAQAQGSAGAEQAEGGGAAIGCTCACHGGGAGGGAVQLDPSMLVSGAASVPPAGAQPPAPSTGAGAGFDSAPLKIKGKDISPQQRDNIRKVLEVGKEMGASRKVLESAVATVIQESNAELGHDNVDHDSVGIFQQRPSMGWGTVEQCKDPKYAARKYFEKAIESDRKNGGQSITQLAQSVQRSAFPDAYAKWGGEAKAAVDAFGG